MSQPSKKGLRSISKPSRKSPSNRASIACCCSGESVATPASVARTISSASTKQSASASCTASSRVMHAPAARFVNEAPDLAQAPTQFAAWIIGRVPQQFAKLTSRDRPRRQRQVGEQRARLARRRQCEGLAIAVNRQRPEQSDVDRGVAAGIQIFTFYDRFHASSHARCHALRLRLINESRRARRTGRSIAAREPPHTQHLRPYRAVKPRPFNQLHRQQPAGSLSLPGHPHEETEHEYRRRHPPPSRADGPHRPHGAQGSPAVGVVIRRLRRRRHDLADCGRGAVRGARRTLGTHRARRRGRQRQRLARRGAPMVRCRCNRLRSRVARARPRARRGRASGDGVPRGRCGGAGVRRRQLSTSSSPHSA